MFRRIAAVILSVILLSSGWLSLTGLTLPVALVPLLWISSSYGDSRKDWWRVFGWAALTFALWNISTIWWIWGATPVGPVAATLASTFLNMIAFMVYHTISKKAHTALAYTALVSSWIATEYWYTVGEFSWPWLILGNGFSHDVWAVQWYEYTGVFGGSLWVLVANLFFFEVLKHRHECRRYIAAGVWVVVPLLFSLVLWHKWKPVEGGESLRVSVVQPNVDCYDKFHGDDAWQIDNIKALLKETPRNTDLILLPETALPGYYWEPSLSYQPGGRRAAVWDELAAQLAADHPEALLVTGTNVLRRYEAGGQTATARKNRWDGSYYDIYNSAVGIDSAARWQIHRKGRLVIGVEKTPLPWLFEKLEFLVIDLGGTLGQIGVGQSGTTFTHKGVKFSPAICYEGLYGDYYGDFVRHGAQLMTIISNDGWWGDTPGYRHLFTLSRLRAIEHRRAIARSANTGRSGFISARGDIVGETLGWKERGVLTGEVKCHDEVTFYTRYGDYIGRISQLVMLLSVLYYVAYRAKKKNYLVE